MQNFVGPIIVPEGNRFHVGKSMLGFLCPLGKVEYPGKVESNFFCYVAMCFPHIGMFSFLHRKCINLLKGRLCDKMYLNSILSGVFLC